MKVSLIAVRAELMGYGIRLLSSFLRAHGVDTQLLFVVGRTYPSNEVIKLCQDSDLIGLSVMTSDFEASAALTHDLRRKLSVPIIWGGVHPTVRPRECLEFADIVCRGEGEDALVELVKRIEHGEDWQGIQNLWIRNGGHIVMNNLRPLIQDLNRVPEPDYSFEGHYLVADREIVQLTKDTFKDIYLHYSTYAGLYELKPEAINYPVMATRGCPHRCSFCINAFFQRLYQGQRYLRRRDPRRVMQELVTVRQKLPDVASIVFFDDNILAASDHVICDFFEMYRHDVGLPFCCQISSTTINETKLRVMAEAGLYKVIMGVETGSSRIAKLYHRSAHHDRLGYAIELINHYKQQFASPRKTKFQFIVDNPYEKVEDIAATFRLILQLKQRMRTAIFSLILFPGTELYEMARQDGLIRENEERRIYNKQFSDYESPFTALWVKLYERNAPWWVLRLMVLKPVIHLMNSHTAATLLALGFRFQNWLKSNLL